MTNEDDKQETSISDADNVLDLLASTITRKDLINASREAFAEFKFSSEQTSLIEAKRELPKSDGFENDVDPNDDDLSYDWVPDELIDFGVYQSKCLRILRNIATALGLSPYCAIDQVALFEEPILNRIYDILGEPTRISGAGESDSSAK